LSKKSAADLPLVAADLAIMAKDRATFSFLPGERPSNPPNYNVQRPPNAKLSTQSITLMIEVHTVAVVKTFVAPPTQIKT
jgi:hypothetical protein